MLIVVADDDEDDQMLVKQAIGEILECEVHSVYNGEELLDFLLSSGSYDRRDPRLPDFILLDLNMPMLDGFGVLNRIRKEARLQQIPIYVLSTSRLSSDKKKSLDLGARAFYTKPILYQQLKDIIEDIGRREMR